MTDTHPHPTVDVRDVFQRAVAAWNAFHAERIPLIPDAERGLREAVTEQFEALHHQPALRLKGPFARPVVAVRIELLDPPLRGLSFAVGFTRPLLEPLAPVRFFHGRSVPPPPGGHLVTGWAVQALDLIVADLVVQRRANDEVREAFERWMAGRAGGAADLAGLAEAVPTLAPFLRAHAGSPSARH